SEVRSISVNWWGAFGSIASSNTRATRWASRPGIAARDALTGSGSKAFTGLPMCLWYCTRYEAASDLPMPPLPCSTRWMRRRSVRLWLGFPDEALDVLVRRGGVPLAETIAYPSFIGCSIWKWRDGYRRGWWAHNRPDRGGNRTGGLDAG